MKTKTTKTSLQFGGKKGFDKIKNLLIKFKDNPQKTIKELEKEQSKKIKNNNYTPFYMLEMLYDIEALELINEIEINDLNIYIGHWKHIFIKTKN
jgi:hypothetical protein